MYSKLVFVIPLMSLIYLFRTIFFRSLGKGIRISLIIPSSVLFLFDMFIALYFYSSCFELSIKYNVKSCLSWIYPTLDFKIMVLLSVVLFTAAMWGLIAGWSKKAFFILSGIVLFLGVTFRLLIIIQSIRVVSISGIANTSVIFEFFTIVVIYGLVSAVIFIGVSVLSFFRRLSFYLEEE